MKMEYLLKNLLSWFVVPLVVFVILLGILVKPDLPDEYYKNMAAIRMASSHLIAGNRRLSYEFNPDLCRVVERKKFPIELIDVVCTSEGRDGQRVDFPVYFSNGHRIFDAYYYLKMNNK